VLPLAAQCLAKTGKIAIQIQQIQIQQIQIKKVDDLMSQFQFSRLCGWNDEGDRRFELPGAKPHYNPDRPGQVEHIALDLSLNIPEKSYSGTCTIRLKPVRDGLESLTLDAVNLSIEAVTLGNTPLAFEYDGAQLQIHLDQPTIAGKELEVAIAYHNDHPQRGLYFVAPEPHYPHKPVQVWTQGEDEDSRYWFPCFDYPGQLATSEIRVRVPQPLQVISNGELASVEDEGGDRIFHWVQTQVHPTYLMTLAVGDFAEFTDTWYGIPVTYYVEKSRQADALRSMGKTPAMIEFFSTTFGYPYPFPKYAQVCVDDFIFGGMENTSTTLLTDRCLLDERAALDNLRTESLVAHELAHQWFGDLVVIKHWSHAWLKEGMATYSEVLWTDHEYGADAAAYYRLGEIRSYLEEDRARYRRPIVTHVYREAIELYDGHLYEKGACVYHMIRAELGDALFFKAIHTFVNDNAHQTVETVDLLRAIEKATGRNLSFLFDQYVFRGGHPDYKVAYSWDNDSKLAKLTVTQTQAKEGETGLKSNLFDLKIPVGFGVVEEAKKGKSATETSADKTPPVIQTFTVRVHEKEQTFYFPLSQKPQFISFDVGNHTLKTVTLDYPVAELKAQVSHDPDPLSRIEGAIALAKKGSLEAVKTLTTVLTSDPVWGVRAEAATQLGSIKLDQAVDALAVGLQDSDAHVRRAVLEALGQHKTATSYKMLKQVVEKGDPSYYAEAAAIRAIATVAANPIDGEAKDEKVLKLLKSVLEERAGWNEIVRSGAIAGLSQLKTSADALGLILNYTAPGTPQALRLAAIRALGAIASGQPADALDRILEHLTRLADEAFFLTQVAVVAALGQMETPRAIGILQSLGDRTPDGRVRRIAEEAVKRVSRKTGDNAAVKKLQEDLEQLKKDNQDLRSRLEHLEAKTKKS